MSDTVIRDTIASLGTIEGTYARLTAVLTILDGCGGRADQAEARRLGRQDVEAGFNALLSDAARLAVLQPEIGRALTARAAGALRAMPDAP